MMNNFTPHRQPRVMIREFEGDLVPFDPEVLQTKLIGCFLAAGLRESVDLPQDIALAVEYTLRSAPRSELIFGRGELERAVIRLLEETGFPEVAKLYRSGCGTENELFITPDRQTLTDILCGHLGCSGELFEQVISSVVEAVEKLEIKKAPAHLFLELARYYEHELELKSIKCDVERTPEITLSRSEIRSMFSPEAEKLAMNDVLRVDGITTLFPCVHIFFRMEQFAKCNLLTAPVTELTLAPFLYDAGAVLAGVQRTIEQHLKQKFPVIVAVPDMFDFISNYAGGDREGSKNLAAELANILCSSFPRGIYKLDLN